MRQRFLKSQGGPRPFQTPSLSEFYDDDGDEEEDYSTLRAPSAKS